MKSLVTASLLYFSLIFIPFVSEAAPSPIGAKAVFVEGDVNYISATDTKSYAVELNTSFSEGDRIITGTSGKVEIEFETGGALFIDSDTELVLKSVQKDNQGIISAIFDLPIGKVKSSFSKINISDKVEYLTKAAIIGLAGTPEHVIKADVNSEGVNRASVYLLGEKGDKGSLFVRGFDPARTEVFLNAVQGTTVLEGFAPLAPFVLTPEILKSIEHMIFNSGGGAAGGSMGTIAAAGGGLGLAAVAAGSGGGGSSGGGSGESDSGATDDDTSGGDTTTDDTAGGETETPSALTTADVAGTWSMTGGGSCGGPITFSVDGSYTGTYPCGSRYSSDRGTWSFADNFLTFTWSEMYGLDGTTARPGDFMVGPAQPIGGSVTAATGCFDLGCLTSPGCSRTICR